MIYSISNFDTGLRVDEAAYKRAEWILRSFDRFVVNFSGGKDSHAMATVMIDQAMQMDMTDKLDVVFFDLETEVPPTYEFVQRYFDWLTDNTDVRVHWVWGYYLVRNATKKHGHGLFRAFDGSDHVVLRQPPARSYVEALDGTFIWEKTITYARDYYLRKRLLDGYHGKVAVCIGITKFESLNRLLATTKVRKGNYLDKPWTTLCASKPTDFRVKCYPIYDWRAQDVWQFVCCRPFHNTYYDDMLKAGYKISDIRTENTLHGCGLKNLNKLLSLYPDFGKNIKKSGLIGDEWGNKHKPLPRQKSDGRLAIEKWSELL